MYTKGLSTNHHSCQFHLGGFGFFYCIGDFAIPQDGNSVANSHHFDKFMADKYHRKTGFDQTNEGFKKYIHFLRNQNRCGLIHDKNPGVSIQGFKNLHPLAFTDG